MDQHKEEMEEENKFQESPEQQQLLCKQEEDRCKESMDQQQAGGYKEERKAEEEEETVVQLKEVVESVTEGQASPSPPPSVLGVFANPCSLLQYLLRACARWCRGLHGALDDGPKPAAAPAQPEAVASAPANSTEQADGGGGEKANCFYMQEVVTRTRVMAVRRGRPPAGGPRLPREGPGGNGIHH